MTNETKLSVQPEKPAFDRMNALTGLSAGEAYDLVVHASPWTPQQVFAAHSDVEILPREGQLCRSYLIRWSGQRIAWVCAENVLDSVLTTAENPCQRHLYLTAASALTGESKPGDLLVPNKAIYGADALACLEEMLNRPQGTFEERRTPPRGVLWVNKAALRRGVTVKTCTVCSAGSRLGAAAHRQELLGTNAAAIDRDCAVFSRCMARMGRAGATLLVVTDRLEQPGGISSEERADVARVVHQDLAQLLLTLAERSKKAA